MITETPTTDSNVNIAEAYYNAMGDKNIEAAGDHLHPDVRFIAPFGNLTGKQAVLSAAKNFVANFNALTIRSKFGSPHQVMLAYDLDCPAPVGIVRTAALMTFKDDLIARIELFYDARPFETKSAAN
jgi:hypothetical protein